ncbi:MAG: YggS family pyridoxal phosphate-dependent enzyme [Alphaproteobacteria bacterium]|nr:YggS family pyridoxal phosphate-dependent enzyme [Alphaproteobacteria bacterium]
MNDSHTHGSLATRLAALQQGLAAPSPVDYLRAGAPDGGLAPKPLPLAARPGGFASPHPTTQLAAPSPVDYLRAGAPDGGLAHPILIGASKTQPVALLEEAITLGLTDFGENRVQEAAAKWPALRAKYPNLRLHLIGPLQSNKAAEAVALFDVIHSIDRVKIAEAVAAACRKQGRHPALLIQVNTGEEPQKAGVPPRDVAALLAHCRTLGLPVVGLMCVPPEGENPAPHFALMKKMAAQLGLCELSMGMSSDYETALRLGSTMIRVGTALFGARDGH